MGQWAGIPGVLFLVCGLLLPAGGAGAQGFPVYREYLPVASLNSDRLFSESLAGKAILDASQEKSAALGEENRRIEADLEEEERDLTEKRKTMPAEEFRKLAEAFDQKVVAIRRTQNAKATALGQELENARREFSNRVRPVLQQLMQERGIVFVLNEQAIALAVSSGNITDEAIRRVDREIGATLGADK
jgi:Skp family chaperone for outer membrane proteins